MSEFNEVYLVALKEKYGKYFPSFLKKVIDYYDLWEFSLDSLKTLKTLSNSYNFYLLRKEGKKICSNGEKIANRIYNMSSEMVLYSEILGLAYPSKKKLYILNWAIYFLIKLKETDFRSEKNSKVGLFEKELKDFKNYFYLNERKCSTPFDSLTEEDFSKVERHVCNYCM